MIARYGSNHLFERKLDTVVIYIYIYIFIQIQPFCYKIATILRPRRNYAT